MPSVDGFDPAPDWRHLDPHEGDVCIVDLSRTTQWQGAKQARVIHVNQRYGVARLVQRIDYYHGTRPIPEEERPSGFEGTNMFAFYAAGDPWFLITITLSEQIIGPVSPPDFLRNSSPYFPYYGSRAPVLLDLPMPIPNLILNDGREAVALARALQAGRQPDLRVQIHPRSGVWRRP